MPFFQKHNENEARPDYNRGNEVAVIVSFNLEGKMRPLYLSIEDDRGDRHNVQITGVSNVKELHGVHTYYCTYDFGSTSRECVLQYFVQRHTWVLLKY